MKILNEYLSELHSKSLMNNYVVRPSPIHGNGVFATKPFRKGDFINTHFNPNYDITEFGRYLNHSPTPTAKSVREKDYSFKTYAERDIEPGEEITLDYTKNKDLEQPQKNWNLEEKRVILKEPPEGDGEIEVQVDPDDERNIQFSPNTEDASATVYGQGTPPDPEDETYLNQLKGSTKAVKVKIRIDKDNKTPDPSYKNVH